MSMMTAVSDLDYYNETNPEVEECEECGCLAEHAWQHDAGCPRRTEGPNAEARRRCDHAEQEADHYVDECGF